MKIFVFLVPLFLFSGCGEYFETPQERDARLLEEKIAFEKRVSALKEIELKKLSMQTQKELELIKAKKELAKVNKEKELAEIKLKSKLEKERIALELEKEKALFEQKMQEQKQSYDMEMRRYFVFGGIFIFGLLSFFIYTYFKNRREDKLRAYNDNLEKYFHQKENDARLQIANKMLDTLSQGNLNKEQENALIGAFSAGMQQQTYQKQEQELLERNDEFKQIQQEPQSEKKDVTDAEIVS